MKRTLQCPYDVAGVHRRLRHIGHVASFCGRRLHTEITRCNACDALVSVQQYPVARGQR